MPFNRVGWPRSGAEATRLGTPLRTQLEEGCSALPLLDSTFRFRDLECLSRPVTISTDHFFSRDEPIQATLAWLDRYSGTGRNKKVCFEGALFSGARSALVSSFIWSESLRPQYVPGKVGRNPLARSGSVRWRCQLLSFWHRHPPGGWYGNPDSQQTRRHLAQICAGSECARGRSSTVRGMAKTER